MNSNQKTRKAKAGLLLIASPRFKTLGEGSGGARMPNARTPM